MFDDLTKETIKTLESFDGTCDKFIEIMDSFKGVKNILTNKYFNVWKVSALYRILGTPQPTDLGSSADNIIAKYLDFKSESHKDKKVGEFIALANCVSP